MKLLVGLGNPGKEYEKTRHNVGFRVLQALAKQHDFPEWKNSDRFQAFVTEKKMADEKMFLALPKTFMNLSGKSVAALINFYKLDPKKDLLIISDDKDMVFGKLRERSEGSSGGHKGLDSIIEQLGTEKFHRLKIGVGHEDQQIPTEKVARSAVRSGAMASSASPSGTKDAAGRNLKEISSGGERFPTAAFVLQKFSKEEEEKLPRIIDEAIKIIMRV